MRNFYAFLICFAVSANGVSGPGAVASARADDSPAQQQAQKPAENQEEKRVPKTETNTLGLDLPVTDPSLSAHKPAGVGPLVFPLNTDGLDLPVEAPIDFAGTPLESWTAPQAPVVYGEALETERSGLVFVLDWTSESTTRMREELARTIRSLPRDQKFAIYSPDFSSPGWPDAYTTLKNATPENRDAAAQWLEQLTAASMPSNKPELAVGSVLVFHPEEKLQLNLVLMGQPHSGRDCGDCALNIPGGATDGVGALRRLQYSRKAGPVPVAVFAIGVAEDVRRAGIQIAEMSRGTYVDFTGN